MSRKRAKRPVIVVIVLSPRTAVEPEFPHLEKLKEAEARGEVPNETHPLFRR